MEKTIQIITKNKDRFPHFEYYLNITDKINENIRTMPDVSIESCKALVEGISKTILDALGESYIEKGRSADGPDNLAKKAVDKLSVYSSVDPVATQSICSFVKRISEVRNERGDISHGKPVPKNINSDIHLAEMVAHTTDGIIYYILNIFFNTELPVLSIKYEDCGEFNDFLDAENELDGVTYSKALFDQDPVAYREQFNNFTSDKEQ